MSWKFTDQTGLVVTRTNPDGSSDSRLAAASTPAERAAVEAAEPEAVVDVADEIDARVASDPVIMALVGKIADITGETPEDVVSGMKQRVRSK
jgi:hypothetical protein